MLIKEVLPAGELYGGHIIYKIKSIAFLHFGSENNDIGLLPCKKHQNLPKKKSQGGLFDVPQKATFAKTWGTIKSATNTIKNTTQQAAALATSQVNYLYLFILIRNRNFNYIKNYILIKISIGEIYSEQEKHC